MLMIRRGTREGSQELETSSYEEKKKKNIKEIGAISPRDYQAKTGFDDYPQIDGGYLENAENNHRISELKRIEYLHFAVEKIQV